MKHKTLAVRVCICAIAAIALCGEVWAGRDSDAVRQFGLVGVWRLDCGKPVDNRTNVEVVYAAPEQGMPTVVGSSWVGLLVLRDVQIIAPDRLVYTHISEYGPIVTEVVKRNGRIFQDKVTMRETGKVLVKDGAFAETGKRSPLYEPCQALVPASPDHNAPR